MNSFPGMPPNASSLGAELDHGMSIIHWLMLVLFVGWTFFFIYTLVRFRQSRNPEADYAGAKSRMPFYLAFGVAVIEMLILAIFDVPFWIKRVDAFPAEPEATVVRVVAEQFAWNIHYPGPDGVFGRTDLKLLDKETNPLGLDRSDPYAKDDITTINQMHLPVNKPVIVYLTSKDVIHSFFLPVMRVKQDAIPGMEIPLWFKPIDTVNAQIACAQLCGIGHYRMRGYLTVETPEEYAAWMQEQLSELPGYEEDTEAAEPQPAAAVEN